MSIERMTVTLGDDLVKGIDRLEKNRSRFVAEAVRREIDRRLADQGLEDWASGLPDDDVSDMLDPAAGQAVTWVPGEGWVRS
jgi:predicted transcriptional regulator